MSEIITGGLIIRFVGQCAGPTTGVRVATPNQDVVSIDCYTAINSWFGGMYVVTFNINVEDFKIAIHELLARVK